MSHYAYHKKILIETPDNKLLFLALYSDSSVTALSVAKNGRTYEYHPKHWCIISGKNCLLIDKEQHKKEIPGLISHELQKLNECYTKWNESRTATINDKCYAGTVYPSGGKIKDMRAFYSIRKTVDAASYIKSNPFRVSCSIYDAKTYKTLEAEEIYVDNLQKLYDADDMTKVMMQKDKHICLDIRGLLTGDEFK